MLQFAQENDHVAHEIAERCVQVHASIINFSLILTIQRLS